MESLKSVLSEHPIVYVTRDIERALGLSVPTQGYFIISNSTPYAKSLLATNDHILLIESKDLLDTHELLNRAETQDFIASTPGASILVFKNTIQIERMCEERGWPLLNPSARLATTIEEKISQVTWLDDLEALLPPHHILPCQEIVWQDTPFIVQFNHAHTGNGTILVTSSKTLEKIQTAFPNRPARVTEYIKGHMFTSNNLVAPQTIIKGNISYQITGLPPFTDQPFATIGNDWGLATQFFQDKVELLEAYNMIVEKVGQKLRAAGWKGLFGVDIMVDSTNMKAYLIEINARQPASTTFESELQNQHSDSTSRFTTFEGHLAALLGLDPVAENRITIQNGAQIILRNQATHAWSDQEIQRIITALPKMHNVISYSNTTTGSDRLRIQTITSLLSTPNTFNSQGQAITDCIPV